MENVGLPTLYHPGWYSGNMTGWPGGLIGDGNAYLVGEARLRMLRITPGG